MAFTRCAFSILDSLSVLWGIAAAKRFSMYVIVKRSVPNQPEAEVKPLKRVERQ